MTPRALEKLIAPLRRRVALMVGRCVVNLVNDALKMQNVQINLLSDETLDRVERLQSYGFTSNPHPGAEGVALAVGGSRNHTVLIACDDRRYRKKDLAPGEAALYTDEGDYVLLKRGRIVEVKAGTKVRVDAPLAEFTGNVTIAGTLTVTGLITGQGGMAISGGSGSSFGGGTLTHDGVNVGKTHVHGGVTVGAGNTGAPQ